MDFNTIICEFNRIEHFLKPKIIELLIGIQFAEILFY
jgi:hypothetical protein